MEDHIRIKNDVAIEWLIYEGEGKPYDLADKKLSFYLIGPMGRMKVDDFTVLGNSLRWTFYGKDQKYTGMYSVELCENEGEVNMHTVDVCKAFYLDACGFKAGDGSNKNITLSYLRLQSTVAFGGGPDVYVSAIKDKDLEMPYAIGGIPQGTKVSDLEGKTFSELADEMLFPTVTPTFTAPSVVLSLDSGSTLREVGAAAPKSSEFAVTYNPGAIMLLGERQAYRAGANDASKSFVYVGGSASNKTLPDTVSLGSTKYNFRAYYAAGPQPYDNKGKAYDAPLPAGYVDSNAIEIFGTLPWYATTAGASAGVPVKQALIRWNSSAGSMATPEFTLVPTDTSAQVISAPRPITEIFIKDETSGNFIQSDLTSFQMKQENRTINGISQPYYTYTYTGSGRGSITLKIKF
jgi:hypothetical protein